PGLTGPPDEPTPGKQFQQIVFRSQELPLEGLATADEIPDAFLRFARDSDWGEFPSAKQPSELDGIVPIVFPLDPRLRRNERRRNHLTRIPPSPSARDGEHNPRRWLRSTPEPPRRPRVGRGIGGAWGDHWESSRLASGREPGRATRRPQSNPGAHPSRCRYWT